MVRWAFEHQLDSVCLEPNTTTPTIKRGVGHILLWAWPKCHVGCVPPWGPLKRWTSVGQQGFLHRVLSHVLLGDQILPSIKYKWMYRIISFVLYNFLYEKFFCNQMLKVVVTCTVRCKPILCGEGDQDLICPHKDRQHPRIPRQPNGEDITKAVCRIFNSHTVPNISMLPLNNIRVAHKIPRKNLIWEQIVKSAHAGLNGSQ